MKQKVAVHVKLPLNCQVFLKDSSNKKEMFEFLTKQFKTAFFQLKLVVCQTKSKQVRNSTYVENIID